MKEQINLFIVVQIAAILMAITLYCPNIAISGDLEPPGPPSSTMKTLDEIPPTWSQKLDPSKRFELVLDGTAVLDKETGLVWEQSPDTSTETWSSAFSIAVNKTVGDRRGWRLPTIEELNSLVDPTQATLTLPSGHPFDNVHSAGYWSSTTAPFDTNSAYSVGFHIGQNFVPPKTNRARVWCVRGGKGYDGY